MKEAFQIPTLEPKVSALVLLSTPQPPTGDSRCKKQVPKVPKLKKSVISAVTLFNKSCISAVIVSAVNLRGLAAGAKA